MSTETIGTIILLASFFIMIFAGNHIIFSIGISTLLTLLYLKVPLMTVAQQSVKGLNSFSLMAVPFFILMGDIMSAGGITDRLVGIHVFRRNFRISDSRCGITGTDRN